MYGRHAAELTSGDQVAADVTDGATDYLLIVVRIMPLLANSWIK